MPARRIILNRSWKHPYKTKPYPVGTILQVDDELGTELIMNKSAEEYTGPYPPKEKKKMALGELKTE